MSQDDLIATLKAAAEKATPGQWIARSEPFDDWGVIRSKDSRWVVAKAHAGHGYTEADLNIHRLYKTDPYGHNAEFIVAACPENILKLLNLFTAKDALIASLNAEISRQNKAEEELLATGEKLAEERNL